MGGGVRWVLWWVVVVVDGAGVGKLVGRSQRERGMKVRHSRRTRGDGGTKADVRPEAK